MKSTSPFSKGPDRVVDCFEVAVARVVKKRKGPPLKRVFIPLLDGLPAGKYPVRGHQNRVLCEKRGHCGCVVVLNASLCLVASTPNSSSALGSPRRSRCWAIRGSGVFVCWANVGKVKLIANPTRASRKPVFIGFLPGGWMVCHLATGCGISLQSPGAEGTPFGQRY